MGCDRGGYEGEMGDCWKFVGMVLGKVCDGNRGKFEGNCVCGWFNGSEGRSVDWGGSLVDWRVGEGKMWVFRGRYGDEGKRGKEEGEGEVEFFVGGGLGEGKEFGDEVGGGGVG